MDTGSSFTIGRVRGIAINVHWSWLVILAMLTWGLSEGLFPEEMGGSQGANLAAGFVTALLFFSSVLLHELAHSFVALHYKMAVPSITLFIFGGVSSIAAEMRTPGQEFKIAIAGPLTSWGLGFLFGAAWLVLPEGVPHTMAGYLSAINFILGVFNLLPGFPLDGGRVLRAALWARSNSLEFATRWAARSGVVIAYLMIAFGLINLFFFGIFGGLWYVLIGLFLKSASENAYSSMMVERALKDVDVASVMRESPEPVVAYESLQQLVDDRLLRTGERAFLVAQGGRIVGLISSTDVAKVPRETWPQRTVESAMVPSDRVHTVAPTTMLLDAAKVLQEQDIHQLPVLEDGRVVGLLTRSDVMRSIELRTTFHRQAGGDGRAPAPRAG